MAAELSLVKQNNVEVVLYTRSHKGKKRFLLSSNNTNPERIHEADTGLRLICLSNLW
jgi:hypothetical protein